MVVVLHASLFARYAAPAEGPRTNPVDDALLVAISRMGVGVTLFFVISGYCIAATADTARRTPAGVGRYFVRRFRRIFPPYWAALGLTGTAVCLVAACGLPRLLADAESPIPYPGALTWQQWLGNLTLTETWRSHLTPDPRRLQLGPAWSLCYEEQFYAVCGLILLVCPRRFFAGAGVVTVATLGVTAFSIRRPLPAIDGYFFDGHWLMFATGVVVYYLVHHAAGTGRRLGVAVVALTAALAVYVRYNLLVDGTWAAKDLMFHVATAAVFGLVLLGLYRWDDGLANCAALRPLAFCGRLCYSLYLIHWPVVKLISHAAYERGLTGAWGTLAVTIPVSTAVSVAVAWGFHVAVERRFLNPPSPDGGRPHPVAEPAEPGFPATVAWGAAAGR
jgi:peptidoglycan/LPS O-acetylase OafA/YrhL